MPSESESTSVDSFHLTCTIKSRLLCKARRKAAHRLPNQARLHRSMRMGRQRRCKNLNPLVLCKETSCFQRKSPQSMGPSFGALEDSLEAALFLAHPRLSILVGSERLSFGAWLRSSLCCHTKQGFDFYYQCPCRALINPSSYDWLVKYFLAPVHP